MSGSSPAPIKIAILGLGEAGSQLAIDLARAGDHVQGYDPAEVATPERVERIEEPADAVAGCELVLAVTPGAQARSLLSSVVDHLLDGALYADLSTAAPAVKEELADLSRMSEVLFADVALMAPVPGRGVAAPALASGAGAARYAELINARGGGVEVVGERAGEATSRKLLRSILMKGLAAVIIESMEAAEASGRRDWFWGHLVDQLTSVDIGLIERLLFDTAPHAKRRVDEMLAAQEMLATLGVPTDMTAATIGRLRRLAGEDGSPADG